MKPTFYEQLGGEGKVRAVIARLVDAMVADVMIGFFFSQVNVARLKELEYQHAAAFLGAPLAYRGRPLASVHQPRKIQGGQFARRKHILRAALQAEGVAPHIATAWLAHQESLRAHITGAAGDGCDMGDGHA